jgi:hypothetical protein
VIPLAGASLSWRGQTLACAWDRRVPVRIRGGQCHWSGFPVARGGRTQVCILDQVEVLGWEADYVACVADRKSAGLCSVGHACCEGGLRPRMSVTCGCGRMSSGVCFVRISRCGRCHSFPSLVASRRLCRKLCRSVIWWPSRVIRVRSQLYYREGIKVSLICKRYRICR